MQMAARRRPRPTVFERQILPLLEAELRATGEINAELSEIIMEINDLRKMSYSGLPKAHPDHEPRVTDR
jgi:hypothetical protein